MWNERTKHEYKYTSVQCMTRNTQQHTIRLVKDRDLGRSKPLTAHGCELRGRFLAMKHNAKHQLTRVVRKVDNAI